MVGTTVLHYTILAELGAGAMGQVYLARDTRTDRRVALKFVSGVADAESRERLIREARAAARLSHPGIVTLFGAEEDGDRLFLVEEFVEGETLATRLARAPLGPDECRRLARELASALAHAHERGVVHRDLKPDNVLIAPDGTYKIADFGIARLEGAAPLTRTGTVMGSASYLAPERLRGGVGDARADLFALGAVLHEAMGGKRAFPGETEAEVMYRVMNEPPAPLEGLSPGLAPLLSLTVRLMAKEPSQRPASAAVVTGMLEGMDAAASGRGVAAPASAVAPQPASLSKPPPRALWITAAALIVIIGLAVALAPWWRNRGGEAEAGAPPVAVLYFENLADPSDPRRMGSITSNLLITSLAQTNDLNVLSTQRILDAMRQIGRSGGRVDRGVAMDVARRVRARRIVTGSILQTDPNIVMTAEVSDAASGKVLLAERIEGQPGQTVFQVVDQLSAHLLHRMVRASESQRLAPLANRTSTDLEAQRSYARGLEELAAGQTKEAERSFRDAVTRDPEFAQAHFQHALAQWWLAEPGDAAESIASARRNADRLSALERDMVTGLEMLMNRDWDGARRHFARIEPLYPGEKLVRYGEVEATYHGDRPAEAVTAARAALELDPGFMLAGVHLVDALTRLKRFAEADSVGRALLARNPRNRLLWYSMFQMAQLRGDGEAALRIAKQSRAHTVDEVSGLAYLLAFNLGGTANVREWTGPGTASWLVQGTVQQYFAALRAGRFREAMRVADRAWTSIPSDQPPPRIPAADGLTAAISARDSVRALAWWDSISVNIERLGSPPAMLRLGGMRLLLDLGKVGRAQNELARIDSLPELHSESGRRLVRYAHALLADAQGRPAEALEILKSGTTPIGNPWVEMGTDRITRALMESHAAHYDRALAILDTLMRVPVIWPDDAVRLRYWRAQALEALHRDDEARAAYREFLTLWKGADPGVAEIADARAALSRLERVAVPRKAPGARS